MKKHMVLEISGSS